MSNCANIINRLTREVCNIKEELDKSECGRDISELNQSIFRRSDSVAYLVSEKDHKMDCGIPVKVKRTEKCCDRVYDALLVTETTDKDAVLINTKDLHCYGERHCTGFFCFCRTLPVCVEHVDFSVLDNVDNSLLLAALQYCANTECKGTITLEAYNVLLNVLASVGIRTLAPNQAACVYKYLMRNNTHEEQKDDECAEPAEPNEPAAPAEPSDLMPDILVKHIADTSTVTDNTTSNEHIEAKLKALLEATDSETNE